MTSKVQRVAMAAVLFVGMALACRAGAAGLELASWYGEDHRGRLMASGRPFDPSALTCATWLHPLGTWLRVSPSQRRSVLVRVTDRGPSRALRPRRSIDLSYAAFCRIGDPGSGLLRVHVEPVGRVRPSMR